MDKKQRTPAPRDPILVVDDETSMRVALRDVLERAGWKVRAAKSGSEAFAMIRSQEPFALLITDCRMPGMTGIELTRAVRKMRPALPIVMMTAYGTVEDAVAAMKEGVDDYLLKPFSFETVIEVVREAARKDRPAAVPIATAPARRNGDSPTPAMLGEDPSWKSVVRIAEEIADSTATVLLTGESGTGKEVLARHIHRCSGRSGRFVAINCAALPEGVLESELFGHEKGAFTGAILSHKGKFELADGGMILLDEISEIPPALQAKLLRVLQEREVHPIGGSSPIKLDFRVIATSNRDLEVCIEQGRFRQDLFYRLNVIAIRLPPLRSRPGDVVILAEHFLQRFRRPDRPAERFSAEVVQYLRSHRWPGNVRELQNVIERACLLARCEVIQIHDLHLRDSAMGSLAPGESPFNSEFRLGRDSAIPGRPGGSENEPATGDSESSTLQEMERRMILRTLRRTGGNRTRAAQLLGVSVRTIRNKLNQYDLRGKALQAK